MTHGARRTFAGLLLALTLAASPMVMAQEPHSQHAQSEQPLTAWPVVTGSVDASAALPPNADIGQAARVMIPVPVPVLVPAPAPAPAALDAAPSPATDGPAAVAAAPAFMPPTPEEADQTALTAFYTSRRDEPLWVTKTGYTDKALSVIAELKRADDWGLQAAEFELPSLAAQSLAAESLASASDQGAELARSDLARNELAHNELAKAEMSLSLAVLKYARHARGGRIPDPATTLSSYLDRRPQLRNRKALLDDLANANKPVDVLLGLHPRQPQFNLLRQAWLEAKRAKSGKVGRLEAGDLKPGDRTAAVAQLRVRMGVAAAKPGDEDLYDEPLVVAVKGYQELKDLVPADGVVTAVTRAELAKPVKANIDQLAANMQLWRWMPEDLGAMYVNVNVPEYMIRIVKAGEPLFTERVTVGLIDKQTPIFSDQMERVTFKSIWRVPDSIKVREVWPSLLRGGGLMRQHNLRMKRVGADGPDVDWKRIDWSKANMGDYYLYRPPGPGNQLGLVKYSFPSKHYVFMHDTNEKFMFNWSRRANSHGCMRIRNPLQMATVVLGEDKGWDRAKIDDLVKNGPDHNVIELDRKIPVHITYFTARVSRGGKIETWGDVYGHEKRITLALTNKWDKIAKGRDHLAPLDQAAVPRMAAGPKRQPKSGDNSVQSLMSSLFGGF